MTETGVFVSIYIVVSAVSFIGCLCSYADERDCPEERTFWARQALLAPLWPIQLAWITRWALKKTAPDFVKAVIGRQD